MFCQQCGQRNSKEASFCTKCGTKVERGANGTEETAGAGAPKKSKKDRKINITVLITLIMIFTIGVAGTTVFVMQKKVAKEKLELETLTAFSMELEEHKEGFSQYTLGNELEEYEKLFKASEAIIENKSINEIEGFWAKMAEFEEEVATKNKATLVEILERLRQGDASRARQSELKEIEALLTEAESLINDKNFAKANQRLIQLEDIFRVITVEHDNLRILVDQVDTSEFPKIKLYLNIRDTLTDTVPSGLGQEFFYLSEKLSHDSEYIKKEISKVMQLNQHESLNINMVADVSGSMQGSPIESAKQVMSNFLDNVQFGVGDKVELTVFSDGVYTLEEFTDNKQAIKDEIDYLQLGNMTSLYDGLLAAVNKTAVQSGAKCVIAFTDGMDNYSTSNPADVLDAASRYRIPIFIIGIGDSIDEGTLSNLAASTNGFYMNINNVGDLEAIYNKIYRQQKELYLLEYEITDPNETLEARDIRLDIQTREAGGTSDHTYEPKILMAGAVDRAGATDIDDAVGKYLNGFVDAINSNDYSYLESFVVHDSPLYKEVYPYIQRNIKEKLLSYEVVQKTFTDADTCAIVVHETYDIQNFQEPLHMRVLEVPYILKRQSNGTWQFYAFNGQHKILAKI